MHFSLFFALLAFTADARPRRAPVPAVPRSSVPPGPVIAKDGSEIPPYNTTYYFDQPIDHHNLSLGTFQQRYWHTWEFYEAGGPIIVSNMGEVNAAGYTGYLTNETINGLFAQATNGATVVLEHRFYGLSNPYPNLNEDSLKYLNIDQAVLDNTYFALNVDLPMPNGSNVHADNAPWILTGGSYPGGLVSWTMVNQSDVFFAGYSSSGVVESIGPYWEYFQATLEHMPVNCSADVQAVIAYMDEVFTGTNTTAINDLKATFGYDSSADIMDVASSLRYNIWTWQDMQPYTGPGAEFYVFCDALEVEESDGSVIVAGASGWGLEHALEAWGSFVTGTAESVSSNIPLAKREDYPVDNAGRSWDWQVCTEQGRALTGAPVGHPTIVSRSFTVAYDMSYCPSEFPETFASIPAPVLNVTNGIYKGWDVEVDRLFFANGYQDPWRGESMSAEGLPDKSRPLMPIMISNGFHCSDLITEASIDPTVGAVQDTAVATMVEWLEGYDAWRAGIGN